MFSKEKMSFKSLYSWKKKSDAGDTSALRMIDKVMGLLRVTVIRGFNLAVRDFRSSDPYVILSVGKQNLRTSIINKNLNPEWNENLALYITDPKLPVKLMVYDYDAFSKDDKMGDAEIDIGPFVSAAQMNLQGLPTGTVIGSVMPTTDNCLARESAIVVEEGKAVQNMYIRLKNVECGEIQLQLHWG